tara:strand:- start:252 stop:557 length:306 start_codon:yes stop_codon:yes gene_type:complete
MDALLNLLIIARSRLLQNIGIVFVIAAGLFYIAWRLREDGKFVWNPVVYKNKFGVEMRFREWVGLWAAVIVVVLIALVVLLGVCVLLWPNQMSVIGERFRD